MTAGSSPGTSEINSARAGTVTEQPCDAAALDPRQLGPARIELADGDAARQTFRIQPPELLERHALLQHLNETGRATGDQEQRLDGARQLLHPLQQARAGSERALVGNGMRTLVNFHIPQRVELRSNVIVFGDDQCSLDRNTQHIVGAESHRGCGLTNRSNPDGAGRWSQRTSHGAATRHSVESGLEQLQQNTASRIGRVHERWAP